MRFGEPNGDFCSAEWPHPDYVSDMEPACTLFARKFTSEADGKLLEVLTGCNSTLHVLTKAGCSQPARA